MTCRSCTAFLEVLLPELLYRTFASERSMLRTQSTYVQAGADLVWLELEHHWKKKTKTTSTNGKLKKTLGKQ